MRTLVSASIFAALALCACGSSKTAPTPDAAPPTANGVFPAQGFAGRTLRVEITGDGTFWSSATTVSFGTGITTSNLTVASPTDLFVDVAIDAGATLGKNDVTITDAKSGNTTLAKAFEILSPSKVTYSGQNAQGSFGAFQIDNVDTEHPYDDTTDATGAFANVSITGAPHGTAFFINAVTPFRITGSINLDVDAASGAPALSQTLLDGTTITTNMDMLTVTTRTATTLTPGTPGTGTLVNPGDTALFQLAATTPDVDHWTIASTADAGMTFFVLPQGKWANAYVVFVPGVGLQTGSFADFEQATPAISGGLFLVPISSTFPTPIPNADFTLAAKTELALTNAQTAVTTNTTPNTATVVTSPAIVTGAAFTAATGAGSQFWYKITVAAGQVTAQDSIHVFIAPTTTSLRVAGTVVDIFGPVPAGQQPSAANHFAGPSPFINTANGDFNSPKVLVAGTYFVSITWDATDFNFAQSVGGGMTVGQLIGGFSPAIFFDSTVTPF